MKKVFLYLFLLALTSSPAISMTETRSDFLGFYCVDVQNHTNFALARAACDSLADAGGYLHGVLKPAICLPCLECELIPPECQELCKDPLTKYECDGIVDPRALMN